MPARPRRLPGRAVRAWVTAALAGAVVTGVVAAPAPATADDTEAHSSLRAAVAAGESAYDALPRSVVRRAPATRSLQTSSVPTSSDSLGPVARGSLTTMPTAVINVTYRQNGAAWTEEAKAAFESAVSVWEHTIESPVPIEVRATAMTFSDPSVLGGAGPFDFRRNDQRTESPADDVFEPVALANAVRGVDALPGDPDIVADFNPSLGGLYFGTDGNPPPDQIDFKTVVLHELGHGLGLVGTATVSADGVARVGDSSVNGTSGVRSGVSFDTFTYASTETQAGNGGTRILSLPDGSPELKNALTSDRLYWAGQLARTAAGGGKVRLYAPWQFVEGTSYGHLDEATYSGEHPNALMTPFIEPGESISDVGQIAMGMLADMGYPVPALRGARYTAVDPVRLLDTRDGTGTGGVRGRVHEGGIVDLRVTGANGVPADATAVVLNVTADAPSAASDVRVYPTPVVQTPVPTVSNLNLVPGVTRANLVTVPIGNNGRVRLRNSAGSVSLIADLAGYYAPSAAATFTAPDPTRVLNTSKAHGTDRTTPVGPGEHLDLVLSGPGGPVPSGASAVVLTVTAVGATRPTDVRVYPKPAAEGVEPPRISSLNVAGGTAVPNVVVVKLGQDGAVRLRNTAGSVHLLADLAGWYDGDLDGSLFRPVNPSRILDTRTRFGTSATADTTVGPGQSLVLRVAGRAQVPSLARAAILNVTGVGASTTTDVRVYPATATSVPTVSNLNLSRGLTAADLVVAKLGDRSVQLRNTAGQVALVADVAGWFGPAT